MLDSLALLSWSYPKGAVLPTQTQTFAIAKKGLQRQASTQCWISQKTEDLEKAGGKSAMLSACLHCFAVASKAALKKMLSLVQAAQIRHNPMTTAASLPGS